MECLNRRTREDDNQIHYLWMLLSLEKDSRAKLQTLSTYKKEDGTFLFRQMTNFEFFILHEDDGFSMLDLWHEREKNSYNYFCINLNFILPY